MSQFFHFFNRNHERNYFVIAKDGASKSSYTGSGKVGVKRPLEATVKNRLERQLGEDLPNVTLHSGGSEQWFLNTLAAWALTEGNNVYIREEAYKEGSNETERILVHEMKHVLQNKNNNRITSFEDIDRVEAEAVQAENEIVGDIWEEPSQLYESEDEKISLRMTEKEKNVFKEKVVSGVVDWCYEQRILLEEEDYLKFLINLEDYCNRRNLKATKTPYDKLCMEIEIDIKRKLWPRTLI